MVDRVPMALRLSAAFLVISGYLALISVRAYPPILLLIPLCGLILAPWGERVDRKYPAYRIFSSVMTVGFGCLLPLVWGILGLVDAVVTLTIFIQIHLLLHRKGERFYYYVFLMAFFMLLAACVQSPEPVIALVMALFLISGIWAFITLRLHVESMENSARVPARIYLPGTGRKTLEDTGKGGLDSALFMCVMALSLVALLMTVVVFVSFPRIEAGALGGRDTETSITGISESVDLGGGRTITQDPTPVLHAEFPEEETPVPHAALYWRVTTLAKYERASWTSAPIGPHMEPETRLSNVYSQSQQLERTRREGKKLLYQRIFLDTFPEQGLPCLDLVQRVELQGAGNQAIVEWGDGGDFTVTVNAPGAQRLSYDAWSEIGESPAEELRLASADYPAHLRSLAYNTLTYEDLLPETRDLVLEITRDYDNPYDKATAIEAWLSGPDFFYTLKLPDLPKQHPVDAFLTSARWGHCELFSGSMALMLRSIGIPTRVVQGYRGGEYNEADGAYTVRASMAHLWLEVWFPEHGWVVFDPSPRGAYTGESAGANLSRFLSRSFFKAKIFWYREVVQFKGAVHLERLRNLSLGIFSFFRSETPDDENAVITAPVTSEENIRLLILVLLCIAGGAVALMWVSRSQKRINLTRGLTENQARAVHLYTQLRRFLEKSGAQCHGRSAGDILAEMGKHPWAPADAIHEVLTVYNDVRFGGRSLPKQQYLDLKKRIHHFSRKKSSHQR
jgi:hypothetical protein